MDPTSNHANAYYNTRHTPRQLQFIEPEHEVCQRYKGSGIVSRVEEVHKAQHEIMQAA